MLIIIAIERMARLIYLKHDYHRPSICVNYICEVWALCLVATMRPTESRCITDWYHLLWIT